MHPTIADIQRAREVSPRMVGWNGNWTRALIDYERELLEQIARLQQENAALVAAAKAKRGPS